MSLITHDLLENAMNYPAYVEMVRDFSLGGETTSSSEFQGKFWVDSIVESLVIIDALIPSVHLNEITIEKLQKQEMPIMWLAITETWCIDSAHSLPIIYKMSEVNPNIAMKIILRDEPPQVIDNFLTRGSRSIPKIICLDAESLVVLGTWGPRPTALQVKMMLRARTVNKLFEEDNTTAEDKRRKIINILKNWYKEDQTQSIQAEVLESLLY